MLTKSRGAQLLFPVAVLLFMLLSPKKTRIKSVVYVLFMAVPAVGISLYILPYLSPDRVEQKAVFLFAAGMLITVLLAAIVEYAGNLLQKIHWLVYVGLSILMVIVLPIVVYSMVNASVPLELSHSLEEENSSKYISRDIPVSPGEYVLRFEAEAESVKEQPYVYSVSISGKTEDNILFGGGDQLAAKTFTEATESSQEEIQFRVPEGSNLVTVNFVNYYSGTSVKLENAEILDPLSGSRVQKVILKNKYNLESIIIRFQSIGQEKSGIVRFLFYKDGMKIFKDRWLLGGGGGAWEYLYRQYQSYNYPSTQAHNFPLQLGIETGVLGLLVLIALLYYLVTCHIKYTKKTRDKPQELFINAAIATAIAALFMHACIDFDFSESAMLLLFWQLIAVLNRKIQNSLVEEQTDPGNAKSKGITTRSSWMNIAGGVIAGVIVLVITVGFHSASTHAKRAYDSIQKGEMEEAIVNIKKSIQLDKFNEKYVIGYNPIPTRPDIKAGLADILMIKASLLQNQQNNGVEISETELGKLQQQFTDIREQLTRMEKEATNNLPLTTNLAGYHFQTGDYVTGLEYLERAIFLSPFEPSLWYAKTNVYFELTRTYFNQVDDENALKYLDAGLNVIKEATEVNKKNMNPFLFNESTLELLEKMKFMKDYWNKNELKQINGLLHYTLPGLDVNLDQTPDQWRSGDMGLINVSASVTGIQIQVNGSSFIYATNTIILEKNKTYLVEVKLDKPVDNIAFEVAGLINKTVLQEQGEKRYMAVVKVGNEPKADGNQLRIYLESDCVIESIILREEQ
jgi:tetratricopeptide (TPR) repeat protein